MNGRASGRTRRRFSFTGEGETGSPRKRLRALETVLFGADVRGGQVVSVSVCREEKGSGDSDLGEGISDCAPFWGVMKGLVDPSKPEMEEGAACFCFFFAGEKGLEAEAVSVLTARDLGTMDIGISDLATAERGGVDGGNETSGSDLVVFPSLESFL